MHTNPSKLTRAETLLPHRRYLGRGVEAILVLPGSSESFIERSTGLITRSFEGTASARALEATVQSWRYTITEKIAGTSRIKSDAPLLAERYGVVDCVVAYFKRTDIPDPLADETAELLGVHGLFHFPNKTDRFFGLEWAVEPAFRGQGLGAKIFSHNLHMSIELGGAFRWTYTDADAGKNEHILAKYLTWGFRKTPIVFDLGGVPQVTMALSLGPRSSARKLAALAFEEGPEIRPREVQRA